MNGQSSGQTGRDDRGLHLHTASGSSQLRNTMGRGGIHTGQHLAEQLKALDMSAAELARQLQVPTNRITEILNGQRSITGDSALRLGHFFEIEPEFWMNLQKLYELRVAEEKIGKLIKTLPTKASRGK